MSFVAGFDESGPVYGKPVVLAPSASRTSTGSGGTVVSTDASTARLTLAVTAVSGGTPSLTVNVQTSPNGSSWTTIDSFAAKTAEASERKVFTGLDRYVRASWTVTGTTPDFTFSVAGELV